MLELSHSFLSEEKRLMKPLSRSHAKMSLILVLAGISSLLAVSPKDAPTSPSRLDGRLIAVDPLSPEGAMCEVAPPVTRAPAPESRYATTLMAAAFAQGTSPAPRAAGPADEAKRAEVAKRKPLRMIRDKYALFSAVAVDAERNEAVMQDENQFRSLVYDRTTNTPPTAALSEPKRLIGGPQTHLELNCGVYIDPKTGNIFAVNNDTEDHLVVFDRNAKGDVAPTWMLHTPHGAFSIAVDEPAEEMIFTIQH